MGLLYYVGASADTLGESIRRIARYSTLGNEAVRINCSGCLTIALRYEGAARHLDRHQMEYFLLVVVRLFRHLSGTDVTPTRVSFVHGASPLRKAYVTAFGIMPKFGADEDALQFEGNVGRLPVTSADPFSRILSRYCDEMLARRPVAPRRPFRAAVENVLAPLLPHGRPEMEQVAAALNVGSRTLARRLAEEGVTLSVVLDEMRRDLSIRYLLDPTLTLAQVAWLVGYSDAAAFSNAFRRWTGKSPRKVAIAAPLAANGYPPQPQQGRRQSR